jgi:hypothetical protein
MTTEEKIQQADQPSETITNFKALAWLLLAGIIYNLLPLCK